MVDYQISQLPTRRWRTGIKKGSGVGIHIAKLKKLPSHVFALFIYILQTCKFLGSSFLRSERKNLWVARYVYFILGKSSIHNNGAKTHLRSCNQCCNSPIGWGEGCPSCCWSYWGTICVHCTAIWPFLLLA